MVLLHVDTQSHILDSHQSSAQPRNFMFTSMNRPPFSIMHANTSEEHSNGSLRKSIYTTVKAKKEKMHQDQSVSKPSIISEKIKTRLKTAHFSYTDSLLLLFLCIRTYPHHSVHSYAILYLPFRKRKAQDILLCHRHHLYCFSKHDNLSKKSQSTKHFEVSATTICVLS